MANTNRNTIEAYGNKGMKGLVWRREFKSTKELLKWADKNDATISGVRDLEKGN